MSEFLDILTIVGQKICTSIQTSKHEDIIRRSRTRPEKRCPEGMVPNGCMNLNIKPICLLYMFLLNQGKQTPCIKKIGGSRWPRRRPIPSTGPIRSLLHTVFAEKRPCRRLAPPSTSSSPTEINFENLTSSRLPVKTFELIAVKRHLL